MTKLIKRVSVARYILGITLFFMVGCSVNVHQIYRDASYKIDNIDYSNYKIGEEKTTAIGNPIIEIKKYRQKTLLNAAIRPTQDMRITRTTCVALAGPCEEFLPSDRDYEILREVLYNDKEYYVVSASRNQISKLDPTSYSNTGWLFLVGKNGVPLDKVYVYPDYVVVNDLTIEPPNVKLLVKDKVIIESNGYIDEKIIFTGLNSGVINLRYINRSYDEMGNRIDRQEDYKLTMADKIQFKHFILKIVEIKADSVRYVVVSDK